MSTFVPVFFLNNSGSTLYVTGSEGSDLDNVSPGQSIQNGQTTTICGFNEGSNSDNWDWIFLGYDQSTPQFQLYMENSKSGQRTLVMGPYNPNLDPNKNAPQSSPFGNPNCAAVGMIGGYGYFYAFTQRPS